MASHLLLVSCALFVALICSASATSVASSPFDSKRASSDTAGADRAPYPEIVFSNGDGSSTKLLLTTTTKSDLPSTKLNTPLVSKYTGTADVIRRWNKDKVTTGDPANGIFFNDSWRIDQRKTSAIGPDGKYSIRVTWASFQIEYGGTSNESRAKAKDLGGQSAVVAEIRAPIGVKFTVRAFQRAFAESMNRGVQVWMYSV